MVESLAVGIVVLVACVHVAWQLAPTLWRQPFAARLARRIENQLDHQQRSAGAAPHAHGARQMPSDVATHSLQWRPSLLRLLRAPSAGCGDCGGRSRCPAQNPDQNRRDIDSSRLIVASRD